MLKRYVGDGLTDGRVCVLPPAVENQVLMRGAVKWKPDTTTGAGDMLKSTYDADENGIVDEAEEVDGGAF